MSVADKLDVYRMALGGSNVAKAVCKATTREIMGPKKKHVDYLLTCTDNELMDLCYMCDMLLERCRMSSWVIVSKALVTFHSLLSNGNERFFQQLAAKTTLWDLENFLDKTAVTGYDMSSFIKRYSNYLTQKMLSYREMNYDFCRVKRGNDGVLRTLDTVKLLKAITEIQAHIDSLLEVDLQSSEFSNGVINSAFVLLFKDLIKLYACYNDGMINLLEKYYDMNKENCKESLQIYKKFFTRTDQVTKFLAVAKEIGVSEDVIPDLAKTPNALLEALENHYKSLEKGQISDAFKTKQLNLAPITISLKSEEFAFEEDQTEQFSPDEITSEETNGQPTLLQSAQTGNPGSEILEKPWENLFEPQVPQPPTKTAESSNQQNDLLELHSLFQAQQPPPTVTNAFPPSAHFGAPVYNPEMNQPTRQTTNPFEIPAGPQRSGGILQPMNKVEIGKQEMEPHRQNSTGDLHSSLSKVAKSLDNFDLSSGLVSSASTGHQWTAPKPKVKTGGANFQIGTTAGSTLPPGNPISPALPYNAPQSAMPSTGPGIGQPRPAFAPGYTQPQMLGPRPMAYGQQPTMPPQTTMLPQTTMYMAPRPNMNPFGNPAPRNQALF